jgi:Protein of unknown function (DUF3800)
VSGYVTLYLDESGGKSLPAPWGRNPDRHYVLAGLVLTTDQDIEIHREVPRLLRRYCPEANAWEPNFELHYGAIINRRPPYDHLTEEQRQSLSNDVFNLILRIHPVLLGTVVDKELLARRYRDPMAVNEYALNSIIDRFNRHLTETERVGTAVMDSVGTEADGSLQRLVHVSRTVGAQIGDLVPGRPISRLERVLNGVLFTPSYGSPGVQLADFIAYATFSKYERDKSRRFEQIEPLWRRVGTFREPSVIPRPH